MRTKNVYLLVLLFFIPSLYTYAQISPKHLVTIEGVEIVETQEQVIIGMKIQADNLELTLQQMLVITPILRSSVGTESMELPAIVLAGRKRDKILDRKLYFNKNGFDKAPKYRARYKKGKTQSINYQDTIPYQPWMNDADMFFKEELTGCKCDSVEGERYVFSLFPDIDLF